MIRGFLPGLRYRKSQSGFSLLEVIVAMSIMAFSLGALYYAVGSGVRGSQEAAQRTRATMLALSLLDSRSVVEAGGFDEQGEDSGGMRWRMRATPYPTGHDNFQIVTSQSGPQGHNCMRG